MHYAWLVVTGLAAATAAPALTVAITSPRPGLTFTDAEPLDLAVAVAGATGPVAVEWQVTETEGPWRQHGQLTVPVTTGRGAAALPLVPPNRGLFALQVKARCGEATAACATSVAVVFAPARPDPASPCGIFYTPREWSQPPYPGDDAAAAALSHRLLGASWSRLNWWAGSFGKITIAQRDGKPYVTGDWRQWKRYARALRAEGISILGEIAQCPTALSSRPDAKQPVGDAGDLAQRVKPRDYAEWDSLMENLARDFRDEVTYWEVWNEANIEGQYWAGTPEELVELVRHTSAALKRGNPQAKVMGCGFVHNPAYVDRVLAMGLGRYLDILSIHYTDSQPGEATSWRHLLRKHGLDLPIWNTEELEEVPLNNLHEGVVRSFKFMHIALGYDAFRLLVNPDYTCRPQAVWYSVGAHFLHSARPDGLSDVGPGRRVWYFRRGEERLAVLRGGLSQALFADELPVLTIRAEALVPGTPLTATTRTGRSRAVPLLDGQATVSMDSPLLVLSGARRLEVLRIDEPAKGKLVTEAELGTCSAGWARSEKAGFSGGRILEIWADAEPGPDGYWAEVKLSVPRRGRYQVLFAGNGLSRLKPPRSVSPFAWRIDGGEERLCDQATPMLTDIAGAPEGVSVLGEVDLATGEHTFRLRLTRRRDEPDQRYALWFDALALRPSER